jgi:hypothetical protein
MFLSLIFGSLPFALAQKQLGPVRSGTDGDNFSSVFGYRSTKVGGAVNTN